MINIKEREGRERKITDTVSNNDIDGDQMTERGEVWKPSLHEKTLFCIFRKPRANFEIPVSSKDQFLVVILFDNHSNMICFFH